MKSKNKVSFTVKNEDGVDIELVARMPNGAENKILQKVYYEALNEALEAQAPLRPKVDKILREQGLFSDELKDKQEEIRKEITKCEIKLLKGGMTKSQGRDLAIKLLRLRQSLNEIDAPRMELEANTCEGIATNKRYNHMISMCIFYKDGKKPYFSDYDDYLSRINDDDVQECIRQFNYLALNLDPDYQSKLTENKFLKQHGFMNDKFQLVNSDGHLVDFEGNLINEDGRFVNEYDEYVDIYGNLIDEEGNYIIEDAQPFTDDEETEAE